MTQPLVLSLFPGIGLLDMAFEEEGFCVVRGPDLLWGGDMRRFHVPAGRFDGIIGGPPCKAFSSLANVARHRWGEDSISPDMIPEYVRVVTEAQPAWWVTENVRGAPVVEVPGYRTHAQMLNALEVGGEQDRERRFCFGSYDGRRLPLQISALREIKRFPTISGHGQKQNTGGKSNRLMSRSGAIEDALEAQGLPRDFFDTIARELKLHGTDVLTSRGKMLMIGNGVPLPMGRAVARAVKAAMYAEQTEAA
jgi:DNA (cytosine-5)-methyltransferase 1